MEQKPIPAFIVHEPLQPPRASCIGEEVFCSKWRALMTRMPDGWSLRDPDEEPAEVAMLNSILSDRGKMVTQREATVCAQFVTWLGCNIGRCLIDAAERWRPQHSYNCMIVAWTLHNRSVGLGNGEEFRAVDILFPGIDVDRTDLETLEHLCGWLGGAGRGFVVECEHEADQRERHARLVADRALLAQLGKAGLAPA